jgi:hypothetical protein
MYIPEPIRLSSICVSKDPRSVDGGSYTGQLGALKRALSGRIEEALKTIAQPCGNEDLKSPDVDVVDIVYESSKTASDNRYLEGHTDLKKRSMERSSPVHGKRQKQNLSVSNESLDFVLPRANNSKKESACGMSINWQQDYRANGNADERGSKEVTEITIGATGLKRGKKAKTPTDVLGSASRLSRFNFLRRCMRCAEIQGCIAKSWHADVGTSTKKESVGNPSSPSREGGSYTQYKRKSGCYKGEECFNGPLMGYIRSGNGDDFVAPQL